MINERNNREGQDENTSRTENVPSGKTVVKIAIIAIARMERLITLSFSFSEKMNSLFQVSAENSEERRK